LHSRGLQPHGKGAYQIYFSISIISVYTPLDAEVLRDTTDQDKSQRI